MNDKQPAPAIVTHQNRCTEEGEILVQGCSGWLMAQGKVASAVGIPKLQVIDHCFALVVKSPLHCSGSGRTGVAKNLLHHTI